MKLRINYPAFLLLLIPLFSSAQTPDSGIEIKLTGGASLAYHVTIEKSANLGAWADGFTLMLNSETGDWEVEPGADAIFSVVEQTESVGGVWDVLIEINSDERVFLRLHELSNTAPVPVDPTVTAETQNLLTTIHRIGWSDQFAMGHELPLTYTLDGSGDNNVESSDIKDVVGDHVGVHGSDFHFMIDKDAFEIARHKLAVKTAYENGAIITMDYHWLGKYGNSHSDHEQDDLILQHVVDDDDTDGDVTWFFEHLDVVIDIINNDLQCPIVFRPFHEMDGDWFWWGRQVTAATYREAYKILVEYVSARTDLVLFCWSPDISQTNFEQFYPGDEYVDICGRDIYSFGTVNRTVSRLVEMIDFAEAHGKVAAFTETGYTAGGISFEIGDPDWWTSKLLDGLKSDPKGLHIAWVLTWVNTSWSGPYVPHAASSQTVKDDFQLFYDDPATLFQEDVSAMKPYEVTSPWAMEFLDR